MRHGNNKLATERVNSEYGDLWIRILLYLVVCLLSHCVVVWCMGTTILKKCTASKVCVPCRWWQYVGTHLPNCMVPLPIKSQCESSLLWIAWNLIEISVCSMVYHDWWVSWEVKRWPSLTSECSSWLRFFVVSDLLKCVHGRIALLKNYWVSLQCICLFICLLTCWRSTHPNTHPLSHSLRYTYSLTY